MSAYTRPAGTATRRGFKRDTYDAIFEISRCMRAVMMPALALFALVSPPA
jgi:hypothetical protein